MGVIRRTVGILRVCCVVTLWTASCFGEPGVGFSFDIDDNILRLPTKILLFEKGSESFVPVTTTEFAEVRQLLGKPGKWKNFEVRSETGGSFRYFSEPLTGDQNYFVEALEQALKEGNWKGPSFEAFQLAMSDPRTAAETTLITARNHNPITMWRGFDLLRQKGLIKHVPRVKNIWGVGGPNFASRFRRRFGFAPPLGSPGHPGPRKTALVEQILLEIGERPVPESNLTVRSPDGKSIGGYHLWGFSDDDRGNFREARESIQNGLDSGKWKNIKVVLFFTGENNPDYDPEAVVLVPQGKPRPFSPAEEKEWQQILTGIVDPDHLQKFVDSCFGKLGAGHR